MAVCTRRVVTSNPIYRNSNYFLSSTACDKAKERERKRENGEKNDSEGDRERVRETERERVRETERVMLEKEFPKGLFEIGNAFTQN